MDFSPLLKASVQPGFDTQPEELAFWRSFIFNVQFQMANFCSLLAGTLPGPPHFTRRFSHNRGTESCFFRAMKSFTSIDLMVTPSVLTWRVLEGVSEAPRGPSHHQLEHDTAEM